MFTSTKDMHNSIAFESVSKSKLVLMKSFARDFFKKINHANMKGQQW